MNLDNFLIIGGFGMVGKYINFGFKPTSKELNVTDINSIELYFNINKNIQGIIYLASINLRDCEKNTNNAINININGTINILSYAIKLNIPFIYLSSGAVFSSKNIDIEFNENFNTNPNSLYGLTKETSEKICLLYNKSIIIRTGWLFGGNQKTHYKFVDSVINNLICDTEIKGSNNFYGSPTYCLDLINHMKYLIINNKYGIHHVVNSEYGTGYDIAIEISKILNKKTDKIEATDLNNIPNSGKERSNNEKLISIYEYNYLRSWKEALKEYVFTYINEHINIYENSTRNNCRLCDSKDLYTFLNLEKTPLANHFVKNKIDQKLYPLNVALCLKCKHIQLLEIIDPKEQYSNYFYVSSTSQTMKNHLEKSVLKFTESLNKDDLILEIGANDGTCIKYLLDNGYINVVGVDPAENIKNRHNLPIICDYFGSNIIDKVGKNYKLIYAFHCCAHIENIKDVFNTVNYLLDETGEFIMEVGYFYKVLLNNTFDVIYHEHIDYHTCTALYKFGLQNNLKLYKIEENDIQGGSLQFYFSKNINIELININKYIEQEQKLITISNLDKWNININKIGTDINILLNALITNNKKIIGYGASAKLTTFMYQYKLNSEMIKYIIDDNIYKQNYYTPGLHIPICSLTKLSYEHFDYLIIFSCNFTNELLNKLEPYRINGLRIIIPFPEIKII